MKRAVLYVRVSTTEQALGHSLDAQETKLLSYCKHNNIEVVKLYRDEFSAKEGFNRPNYNLFLSDLKEKKIKNVDYFIVTNFSRFSRNLTDALNQKRFLLSKKIELLAIEQPTSDYIPEDLLLQTIYLALPQIEIERLSIRTKDGIKAAKQKGCFVSKAPFGLKRKWYGDEFQSKKLAGLEKKYPECEIVEEIFRLFAQNKLNAQEVRVLINSKYNIKFSRNHIYNILRNKTYCGLFDKLDENGEIVVCESTFVEPIISKDAFFLSNLFLVPS